MHISGRETHQNDCRSIQSLVQLFCHLPCAEHLEGQGGMWVGMGLGTSVIARGNLAFVGNLLDIRITDSD